MLCGSHRKIGRKSPLSPRLYSGNCVEVLNSLPEESIQLCITSPPYYGLRAYGTEPQVWAMTEEQQTCRHRWSEEIPGKRARWGDLDTLSDKQRSNRGSRDMVKALERGAGQYCSRCSAWRGELGQEPCINEYVIHLCFVMSAVHRVLRDDGLLFLNVGDSYCHSREYDYGIKPKDMYLMPERVALRMQRFGWYVRNRIVWRKPNAMPRSVKDTFTPSYETVWMFSKSPKYYFDNTAILEPFSGKSLSQLETPYNGKATKDYARNGAQDPSEVKRRTIESMKQRGGRFPRDVWDINTANYKGNHFATFPTALVEKAVLCATSEGGSCGMCGAPYRRLQRVKVSEPGIGGGKTWKGRTSEVVAEGSRRMLTRGGGFGGRQVRTIGFNPVCDCDTARIVPCAVLDPFMGSGTVGVVCKSLGRRFYGIDLSPDYVKQAKERISDNPVTHSYVNKQDVLGRRDYSGFNKRWKERIG